MKLIEQSIVHFEVSGDSARVERAARTCYRTEPKGKTRDFVQGLMRRKHLAMLEFVDVIVTIKTSRAIANELVRHRHGSYAQESTRYVDLARHDIEVVCSERSPHPSMLASWEASIGAYLRLRADGVRAERARDVLPLALATTIVCKWNLRELLHIFSIRLDQTAGRPHPDMIDLMLMLHERTKMALSDFFDV